MFGTVSQAYILVVYAAFLQHGACANAPTHIKMCQDACRKGIGQETSHNGFLFMRCKLSARNKDKSSSGTTDKTTTAECLRERPISAGGNVKHKSRIKYKSRTCHNAKGLTTGPGPSIKDSTLLILPKDRPVVFGYQMDLADKTQKRLRAPCNVTLVAFVYIRNDQRFLFSNNDEIQSFKLNANPNFIMVRKISKVRFMRYDEDKQLVFLSHRVRYKYHISRMTAGGDEYRVVRTMHGQCFMALDTTKALLYVSVGKCLFRMNYDGEVHETIARERSNIVAITIDAKFNIVYYIVFKTLTKLMQDGQRSAILKFRNARFTVVNNMEFQSNVLYLSSGYPDTSISSITLTRKPVLEMPHVWSRKIKVLLSLV